MNADPGTFSEQLRQFGEAQLVEVSMHDLRSSTVHLILATAFFTGAAIGMANQRNIPRNEYLLTLRIFLEKRFGLNADHAKGLIESNSRLYKRYTLLERIYNAGLLAANEWEKNGGGLGNELSLLLNKYHDLSMSGLNVEGTKEEKQAPAPKAEPVVTVEPVTQQREPPPTRWGRTLLLLLLLILLICIGGAFLFEEQLIPYLPTLAPFLDSVRTFFAEFSGKVLDAIQ